MERLDGTNNIMLMTPGTIGIEGTDKISVLLYGTGGSLTGLTLYVLTPLGQLMDITSYLAEISTGLTFLTLFEAQFTFSIAGRFKFMLHDTVSGDVVVEATF